MTPMTEEKNQTPTPEPAQETKQPETPQAAAPETPAEPADAEPEQAKPKRKRRTGLERKTANWKPPRLSWKKPKRKTAN